ncbi:hypothetical protein WDU94_015556 [Cyamophila willieti]
MSPVPITHKKISNKGLKATPTFILTSSPYKEALEESLKMKAGPMTIFVIKLRTHHLHRRDGSPFSFNQHPRNNMKKEKEVKKEKLIKRETREKKKADNKKKCVISSESDEEEEPTHEISSGESVLDEVVGVDISEVTDAECLFCCEKFSNSKSREQWIRFAPTVGKKYKQLVSDVIQGILEKSDGVSEVESQQKLKLAQSMFGTKDRSSVTNRHLSHDKETKQYLLCLDLQRPQVW